MYQDKDVEIQASRAKLLKTFGSSPDLVFIRAWGNIGDELIYAGTRQLLSGFDYREVSIQNLQNVSGHTALVAGSGGWCKPFHSMPSFLPIIEEHFQSVIVLPSTFDPSEEIVKNTLEKTKALVFAREWMSYHKIRALCQSDIAHDCAFFFNYEKYKKNGKGVLNVFRCDGESTNKPLPEDNVDISVTCSSLDEWLWTISKYDIIRTDRAHVMIAAAMLGKRVEYNTSISHKVPAIAEYALKGYPVTRIPDMPLPQSVITNVEDISFVSQGELLSKSDKGQTVKFANFLAERSASSSVVIVEDMESPGLDLEYPKDAIVIIPNAISSLERFPQLLKPLKKMLQNVQKVLLFENINTVPDAEKLEAFLKSQNLPVEFVGYVNEQNNKVETLAIISSSCTLRSLPAPVNFRVIAVISTFNEEDIIIPVINQLNQDGVEVYLIDNWSTDETYQRANSLIGKGLIGLEKFPIDGPSSTFDWKDLLKRKEELCQELDADWFIHHDADEFRESPWKGICLRDAVYRVDQQGYNAIDFTVLNFFSVDNNYQSGSSFIDYFKYFEFGKHPAYSKQTQAWKKTNDRVNLHESGGHSVKFSDRKIYPYKFLLRHYSIRSQSHGERKVFQERKQRLNPIEKKKGWNTHYDIYTPGSSFIKNPDELIEFRSNFYTEYLIERLSGIGIFSPETENYQVGQQLEEQAVGNADLIWPEAEHEQVAQTLTAQVAEKEQSLQALIDQAAELADIKSSRAWRLIQFFRRIRMKLAPPGSQREKLWYFLFRF